MKSSLTTAQLTALRAFADANGRTWKSSLNDAWMTGMYGRYNGTDDEGSLQQVRNTFGPSWLVKFSFANAKTHSVAIQTGSKWFPHDTRMAGGDIAFYLGDGEDIETSIASVSHVRVGTGGHYVARIVGSAIGGAVFVERFASIREATKAIDARIAMES